MRHRLFLACLLAAPLVGAAVAPAHAVGSSELSGGSLSSASADVLVGPDAARHAARTLQMGPENYTYWWCHPNPDAPQALSTTQCADTPRERALALSAVTSTGNPLALAYGLLGSAVGGY